MMRTALALLCLLACTSFRGRHGNGWAHHELTMSHDVDRPAATPPLPGAPAGPAATEAPPWFSELLLAGMRAHGLFGTRRLGYHAGIDLAFGSTLRTSGFAYDLALFPVGAGLRLGATSGVMLGLGVGATGAIGTLDDAVTLPIELVGELDLGRARILTRARISYVGDAAARHRGTSTVPFADEAEAMLGLRIGHHYESYGFPTGNGYFAALAYRELLGARFIGLTIGYSLDVATPRRRPL
jgi:hypothetical protein